MSTESWQEGIPHKKSSGIGRKSLPTLMQVKDLDDNVRSY